VQTVQNWAKLLTALVSLLSIMFAEVPSNKSGVNLENLQQYINIIIYI